MSDFCKLFTVDGEQVLYLIERGDAGDPCVKVMTVIDELLVALSIAFMPKGGLRTTDDEKYWDIAQQYFDKVDQDQAADARAMMVTRLSGQVHA